MLGCRYKSYCSNIVRTLMVDPPEEMQKNYELLVEAEEKIIDKLRDGKEPFSEISCDIIQLSLNTVILYTTQNISSVSTSLPNRMKSILDIPNSIVGIC